MSEKPSSEQPSLLSEADELRFEQDLPQWLAGHLPPDQAQWMQQMQQRHARLAEQAQWLLDARSVMREQVGQENTDEAWAILSQRLMSAPALAPTQLRSDKETSRLQGPRWLRWLLDHPGWANAAAAAAVVLVVGQAGWIASRLGPETSTAGWRSMGLDDLQSAHQPGTRMLIRLKPGSFSAEMAAANASIAGSAINIEVSWQAQADGRWILKIAPVADDPQILLSRVRSLPFVEQAQLLP